MSDGVAKPRTPGEGPRPKSDFYVTPFAATRALLSTGLLDEAISAGESVDECACGDGAIATVLEGKGLKVHATDLRWRGYGRPRRDFLKRRKRTADIHFTNPPYKLLTKWLNKCFDLGYRQIILLLPIQRISAIERAHMAPPYRLRYLYPFIDRFNMWPAGVPLSKGDSTETYAWFVYEHGYEGPCEIPQLLRFSDFEGQA